MRPSYRQSPNYKIPCKPYEIKKSKYRGFVYTKSEGESGGGDEKNCREEDKEGRVVPRKLGLRVLQGEEQGNVSICMCLILFNRPGVAGAVL